MRWRPWSGLRQGRAGRGCGCEPNPRQGNRGVHAVASAGGRGGGTHWRSHRVGCALGLSAARARAHEAVRVQIKGEMKGCTPPSDAIPTKGSTIKEALGARSLALAPLSSKLAALFVTDRLRTAQGGAEARIGSARRLKPRHCSRPSTFTTPYTNERMRTNKTRRRQAHVPVASATSHATASCLGRALAFLTPGRRQTCRRCRPTGSLRLSPPSVRF
jgi:hypothetical protein